MACRISELVIDCADPERLAVFWSEVLGYVEPGREDDGSTGSRHVLADPEGNEFCLLRTRLRPL